jgi:hypothetical protein
MLGSFSRASRSFSRNQCTQAEGADAVMKSVPGHSEHDGACILSDLVDCVRASSENRYRGRPATPLLAEEDVPRIANTEYPSETSHSYTYQSRELTETNISNEPLRVSVCEPFMLEPRIKIEVTCNGAPLGLDSTKPAAQLRKSVGQVRPSVRNFACMRPSQVVGRKDLLQTSWRSQPSMTCRSRDATKLR